MNRSNRLALVCAAALIGFRMAPAQSAQAPVRLVDVAESAGIDFVYQHSPTPEKYFVESVPGGLAVFDYNGDGRPDIFFTNGARTPSLEKAGPMYANRLYRNDGGMKFTDVTDAARVRGAGYAVGAAAADYDNDGHVDLFIAGVRHNQLLRNKGTGEFEDVTAKAGIASGEWSVAGAWVDYDSDGRLDLLVVDYVDWSPDTNRYCGDQVRKIRLYCHPRFFAGVPNRLYRNRGDGTFEDVSARSGIFAHAGKGMSAAIADLDHDGHPDLFVTNDTVPNFLFRNKGDGTFAETALVDGVSVPASGVPVSSMGTDIQDFDNDGWEDIFFTALAGETFPLYRNDGRGGFADVTRASNLASLAMKMSGWCAVFADMDNDGWKDIFTANSHANDRIGEFQPGAWALPNSLFMNDGKGHFRDATNEAGLAGRAAVHRGCGVADFDGDGRLDVVVLSLGTRAELWKNESEPANGWLIVKLTGTKSNRDGIGARVTVSNGVGNRVGSQVRTMTTAVGYASSSHAGLHFGLGRDPGSVTVRVEWPSGAKQTVENVKANQILQVKEQ